MTEKIRYKASSKTEAGKTQRKKRRKRIEDYKNRQSISVFDRK